jgi:hypothetical protein
MQAEAVGAASTVVTALQRASAATGVDFRYLLGTAMRESGLHPEAQSRSSSATGLFQFVEQTWLTMVKDYGGRYGLSSYANAIQRGPDGRLTVADQGDRTAILRLRNDPHTAALMAAEYTRQSQTQMEGRLGRPVTNGELYVAHFLGATTACRLIQTAQVSPAASACTMFPREAEANHSVFYHSDGSSKSVREVYNWAVSQHGGDAAATSQPAAQTGTTTEGAGTLDSNAAAALLASLWRPQQAGFFSNNSDSSANAPPFAMTPAILDVLQTVAHNRGNR